MSLDSLDDATFRAMNDVDVPVARVLEGIEAAAAAGLPIKVNAVVKRGLNDDGILDLAARFPGTGHILRFIEFMDVGYDQRLAPRRRSPRRRNPRSHRRGLSARTDQPNYPGETAVR